MSEYEKVNYDYIYKAKPKKVFALSPFNINQIQYLRGLIWADQLEENYKELDMTAHMNGISMYDFTNKLLAMLDEFEEGLGGVK